ncbi:MAG TPA: HAMP domain-containing sensor histidine kinase [Candidatus Binatus sp.]|nr:HAMP domain-containing sensor histidine kinase [Candidatus Binatus sp.]
MSAFFSTLRLLAWQRFAIAIVLPLVALSLNWILSEDLFRALVLIPLGAVLIASLIGGYWAGLVSIILSGLGLAWLVLEPSGIGISWPEGYLDEIIFLTVALVAWNAAVRVRSEIAKVQERDQVIAAAAHDLRTPLNTLGLTIEQMGLLAESIPDPEQAQELRAATGRMKRQLNRMTDMIDGLFAVPSSHGNRTEDTDLAQVVEEVLDDMSADIRAAACSVDLQIESAKGSWDPVGLTRIAHNLLANAIKYAPGCPLRVRVAKQGGVAILEVADRGPGVETSLASRIFDRYSRGRSEGRGSGSGLGLYIVRQIVEAHRGKIALQHLPGGGSRFIVKLPLHTRTELSSPILARRPLL